ncbi:winged helix-turn-helix domain-containing protein [Aeromonas salmonicida]|uniref:winged helix-turn-helix domain-containing protein n=1 Tax=Aeromonas salmonicida TaxID=645 RepID=UPI0027965F11|nr:winged helix-turn-helix domain-containing protein [Aeromonas salmonicida]MDQ1886085.1 winged helix-turn-helix domain-containing protein [Aeromonas salmonicida]
MVEYNIEGVLLFQPASFRLFYFDKEIQLSQKETGVLQYLCDHGPQVVERKTFIQELWGDSEGADISLNKSILTLRRKFESLGYLDAINTVPRVGYMLRLHVLAINVAAAEQPKINSRLPAEGKTTTSRFKRGLLYLILIVAGLLSVLLYQLDILYMGKEATPLSYKMAYDSPSLTIIEMAGLKQSVNYPAFISRLPSDNKIQVSISNTAISLLDHSNGTQSWVKVFIQDPGTNINDQLTCIADYITNSPPVADKDAKTAHANSGLEHDDTFQIRQIYTPCLAGTTKHTGDVSTTLTHYSRTLPKGNQPSSWLQQVSFSDNSGALVFDFQVIYRATYLYKSVGVNKNLFLLKLSQRSIKLQQVEQERINNNKYFKIIFNEYEDDDIFVRSLSSVDKKSITVLSSVFDGTISHGLKNTM